MERERERERIREREDISETTSTFNRVCQRGKPTAYLSNFRRNESLSSRGGEGEGEGGRDIIPNYCSRFV